MIHKKLIYSNLYLLSFAFILIGILISSNAYSESNSTIRISSINNTIQVLNPEYPLNIVCIKFVKAKFIVPIYNIFRMNNLGRIEIVRHLSKPLKINGNDIRLIRVILELHHGPIFDVKFENMKIGSWYVKVKYRVFTPILPCSIPTDICLQGRVEIKYTLFNESYILVHVHIKVLGDILGEFKNLLPENITSILLKQLNNYEIKYLVNIKTGKAYMLLNKTIKPVGALPLLPPPAINEAFRGLVSGHIHMLIKTFRENLALIDLLVERLKVERNVSKIALELWRSLNLNKLDDLLSTYHFKYLDLSFTTLIDGDNKILSLIVLPQQFSNKCLNIDQLRSRDFRDALIKSIAMCLSKDTHTIKKCLEKASHQILNLIRRTVADKHVKDTVNLFVEAPLSNSSTYADIILPASNELKDLFNVDYLVIYPFAALASGGYSWVDPRLINILLNSRTLSCFGILCSLDLKISLSKIIYEGLTKGSKGLTIVEKLSEKLLEYLERFNKCMETSLPLTAEEKSKSYTAVTSLFLPRELLIPVALTLCTFLSIYLAIRIRRLKH